MRIILAQFVPTEVLAEKIKKGQFKVGELSGRAATIPEIWRAALAV